MSALDVRKHPGRSPPSACSLENLTHRLRSPAHQASHPLKPGGFRRIQRPAGGRPLLAGMAGATRLGPPPPSSGQAARGKRKPASAFRSGRTKGAGKRERQTGILPPWIRAASALASAGKPDRHLQAETAPCPSRGTLSAPRPGPGPGGPARPGCGRVKASALRLEPRRRLRCALPNADFSIERSLRAEQAGPIRRARRPSARLRQVPAPPHWAESRFDAERKRARAPGRRAP